MARSVPRSAVCQPPYTIPVVRASLARLELLRCEGEGQPQLGTLHGGVALGDIGLALAQRLDLGALKHDAGLEVVLDEEMVAGLAVLGRDAAGRAFLFLGHRVRR